MGDARDKESFFFKSKSCTGKWHQMQCLKRLYDGEINIAEKRGDRDGREREREGEREREREREGGGGVIYVNMIERENKIAEDNHKVYTM